MRSGRHPARSAEAIRAPAAISASTSSAMGRSRSRGEPVRRKRPGVAAAAAARKRAAVPESRASRTISRPGSPRSGPETATPPGIGASVAPSADRHARRLSVSSLSSGFAISTREAVNAAASRARLVALLDGGTRSSPRTSETGGSARKSVTLSSATSEVDPSGAISIQRRSSTNAGRISTRPPSIVSVQDLWK